MVLNWFAITLVDNFENCCNFFLFLTSFLKGRPKLCLWVTTVEHDRFCYLFNVFESFTTNSRPQKCACVILLEMKTVTIPNYSSGKSLQCFHRVFLTCFNNYNVDSKLIHSIFSWNVMQISRHLSENVNHWYFGIILFKVYVCI